MVTNQHQKGCIRFWLYWKRLLMDGNWFWENKSLLTWFICLHCRSTQITHRFRLSSCWSVVSFLCCVLCIVVWLLAFYFFAIVIYFRLVSLNVPLVLFTSLFNELRLLYKVNAWKYVKLLAILFLFSSEFLVTNFIIRWDYCWKNRLWRYVFQW